MQHLDTYVFQLDTDAKQATGFSISRALAANGLSIINRLILFTVNISIIPTTTGIVCSTTWFLKMEYLQLKFLNISSGTKVGIYYNLYFPRNNILKPKLSFADPT